MKQQTHDNLNVWRTRKKSEPQMGFESTTLRDLVGRSKELESACKEYLISFQKHYRSKSSLTSRRLAKEN